ncbi:uncharacterized protein F5Z01DRAFT_668890 [Emericellopsis atlantica]|uniref:Uncharacterized protein n=1 Tax=Emericellopsis atlantica TaxID=2614577 RepID=A0A9P7ZD17_9HYPO|nr:uncharacterized protein F5Z01DRAFT_668890 [Emericellopsis atlantica]KAG9249577.1 hypothetical protein F5Z01DRAFT_668890 [Emericellopsis atlantica]
MAPAKKKPIKEEDKEVTDMNPATSSTPVSDYSLSDAEDGGESSTESDSSQGRSKRGETEEIPRDFSGVRQETPALNPSEGWPTKRLLYLSSRRTVLLQVGPDGMPQTFGLQRSPKSEGTTEWLALEENRKLPIDPKNVKILAVATSMAFNGNPDPLSSLKFVSPYTCGASRHQVVLVLAQWDDGNRTYKNWVSRSALRKVCREPLDQTETTKYNDTAAKIESKARPTADQTKTLASLGSLEKALEFQREMGTSNWGIDTHIYIVKYWQDKAFYKAFGIDYPEFDHPALWMRGKVADIREPYENYERKKTQEMLDSYTKPSVQPPKPQELTTTSIASNNIEALLLKIMERLDLQAKATLPETS